MKHVNRLSSGIKQILKRGGVGVLPTDTIYGLVGSALSRDSVIRIYNLRKRNLKKPMIILIGSFNDLQLFHIKVDKKLKSGLQKLWPGRASIILPCHSKKFAYLHRGTKSLAFRLPQPKSLRNLLKSTGPLVAPSANIEGMPSATTVGKAEKYFGNKVDFYVDKGKIDSLPSTLVQVKDNKIIVKRKGAVLIK